MVTLLQLPPELVHHILGYVEPQDLSSIIRTCHFLNDTLKGNTAVYRSIYHRALDTPPTGKKIEWEREIHDLVRLQRICSSQHTDTESHLPFVLAAVVRLLWNASRTEGDEKDIESPSLPFEGNGSWHYPLHAMVYPSHPRNISFLNFLFFSEETREAFLTRSFIFERARGGRKHFQNPPNAIHQQSAKLHSLFGMALPMLDQLSRNNTTAARSSDSIISRVRPFACSKVYDLREYTTGSGWGPFLNDGSWRVDWEKVEAILLVIEANLRKKRLDRWPLVWALWMKPFAGSWPGSYWPWGTESGQEKAKSREDPYGVTGTWFRVVCFIDYNDFFHYNFPVGDAIPDNVPRPLLNVGEATRIIVMKISVTKIEDPGEGDHPDYPVVTFSGKSRSLDASELWQDDADSDIRGTVRMTPEGEVRWTSYSIFEGEERWKSEGIQIGGLKSGRGVVGNWFDKDHDPHGPCGPTAFWKISNKKPVNDDNDGGNKNDRLIAHLKVALMDPGKLLLYYACLYQTN
ncbi:hypothetical protein V8F06_001967 [Rhypophila decipiens]